MQPHLQLALTLLFTLAMVTRCFAIAVVALTAVSCSSGRPDGESPLLTSRATPAIGELGWNFDQTWSADLDNDGDPERVVLLAQVERRDNALLWEDAQRWVAYVEEPSGSNRRTYFYSRLVPAGRVELFITAEQDLSPRILLLERGGSGLGLWEVRYRGRDNVEVKRLAERAVDRSAFVGGTPDR